jgi:hypothetical protein
MTVSFLDIDQRVCVCCKKKKREITEFYIDKKTGRIDKTCKTCRCEQGKARRKGAKPCLASDVPKIASNSRPKLTKPMFVYFVQGEMTRLIKVGITRNVDQRLRDLQCDSPDRLTLLASMAGNHKLELALHEKFQQSRRHGEWFAPDPDLLSFIAGIASDYVSQVA